MIFVDNLRIIFHLKKNENEINKLIRFLVVVTTSFTWFYTISSGNFRLAVITRKKTCCAVVTRKKPFRAVVTRKIRKFFKITANVPRHMKSHGRKNSGGTCRGIRGYFRRMPTLQKAHEAMIVVIVDKQS